MDCEIVRPICFAVFKMITSSTLWGFDGHEFIYSAVQFLGDVLGSDSHLRPRGNLLAFQVVVQLRHAAKRVILRFALFYAGVKAVFLDACPEHNGERQRIPDPG
jgi:hypothetical protein